MPILSSKPIELEALELQLSPATLAALQAMQIYTESLRQIFKGINDMIELQNKTIIQTFATEFTFNKLFLNSIFNFTPQTPFKAASIGIFGATNIIEGKIEKTEVEKTQLLPVVIPTPRGKMGLSITAANTFLYKRHAVKGLSAKNSEGRVLAYFHKDKNLFLHDGTIRRELQMQTNRSFSWVLRNLKNKLKKNGIKIRIERCWNPDGYIINGIDYIQ